jgi:hypothetical protein
MWSGGVNLARTILNGLDNSLEDSSNDYISDGDWIPQWKKDQLRKAGFTYKEK